MEIILYGIGALTIIILWYMVNMFNKPILSKMSNYYEDDPEGRQLANFIIFLIIVIAFSLGASIF